MQKRGNGSERKLKLYIWHYDCPCGRTHVEMYGSDEDTARENAHQVWQACNALAHRCTLAREYLYSLNDLIRDADIDEMPF